MLKPALSIIGVILALTAAWVSAAPPAAPLPEFTPAVNSAADSLLQKAVAFHRQAKDLTLAFQAKTYQSALDKTSEYSGTLQLKGEGKFRLEIPGTRIVSDGKTVWEHHEANQQVLIKDIKFWDEGQLPAQALFRFLDARALEHEVVQEGKIRLHKLTLDPSEKVKNLRGLVVYLRADNDKVHKIETEDLSDNTTEYRLTRVEANKGLNDKVFRYSVPKGVESVDMRD